MRIELITGAAVLALGMLGSSAALAQNATTGGLSGTAGAMTCGDFTKMDSTAQANVITQANGANSTSYLTSNSGAGSAGTPSGDGTSGGGNASSSPNMASNSNSSGTASGSTAGSTAAGTPLTAGQLVAACQAASPTSTLQDAYAHFNSGTNSTSNSTTSK